MHYAGYSGTAQIKKLGFNPEMKILVLYAPENYFEMLEADVSEQYVSKN